MIARSDGMVAQSVRYLDAHRRAESGAMALALARVCLGVYGRPAADVDEAIEREWRKSAFLGNLHVTALALYTLAAATSYEAFRV